MEIRLENHKKHSLGRRAFLLFLSKRIKGVLFFFIFALALWYSEQWMPPSFLIWGTYAAQLALMLSAAYLLIVLVQTYLQYRFYTYTFTEEAFMMTSGYVVRNEVAALYHQIQNVNIERGPLDRLTGVSKVIIYMTGAERDSTRSKIVLPAVGRTKAKLVQKELLVRARRHFGMPAGA